MKRVLIVGGGFAGLNAAKKLGNHKDISVTLLDRRNHHLFQPLLYQVAMAGLSPAEIAAPIRGLLSQYKNVEVLLGNVEKVNLEAKTVSTATKTFQFDYLILACGSKHSYFGKNNWELIAPGLKTLEQATEIRRRVLIAFENAEREQDQEERKKHLTFAVVGGGPTGVELAGAIGEISKFTLSSDFRKIDPNRTRIILIEAGSRILPSFSEKLSRKAAKDLEKLGVQIWNSSRVTDVDEEGVHIGKEFLHTKTVLWAAGVQPSSINVSLGTELDGQKRANVQADLSLKNHPNVFVLGDQASCKDKKGKPLPGLAPVAIQQGIHAAKNIIAEHKGKPRKPFHYFDKGQMATIGRKSAVLQLGKLELHGFIAWLAWLFIHIYYLIGFKNRLFVLFQWAWYYLSYGKGARLIVDKEWRSYRNEKNSS